MQRKVISLSKDTVLWEAGDNARDIAVVAKGKLAARTEQGLVGIILPNMVLGESALFTVDGAPHRRTATIYALEDETLVMEYPASMVRDSVAGGDDDLMRQIIANLVGQICRNLLMVIAAKRGSPYIDNPLTGLVRGIVRDALEAAPMKSWENQTLTCRFLHDLREVSDGLVDRLGPDASQRSEMIVNASQMMTQLFEGHDVRPLIEAFLEAEKQKTEWWARAR